jgi:hypothetical protein
MKLSYASVALSAGVALGLSLACSARAEPTPPQGSDPHGALSEQQVRIAEATLTLENAFRDQFVQGKIDREALSGPIDQVVQAMPEAARPRVQAHIDAILAGGARAAAEMSPEQRAQAAAPPAAETVGKTQAAIIAGWGWPAFGGFGGYGAFAWPTTYMYGGGCGMGFGACGYGLGMGGWYW